MTRWYWWINPDRGEWGVREYRQPQPDICGGTVTRINRSPLFPTREQAVEAGKAQAMTVHACLVAVLKELEAPCL